MESKNLIITEKKTGLIILQGGDDQKIRDFYVTGESVDSILEQVEKEVSGHVPDVSTVKGRNAITANVTIAGNYKTFFENTGKDLSAEYKTIPSKIDKTRKRIKEYLADLKVKTRKPLTDYENEQKVIAADKLAKAEAEKLILKFNSDHEIALLLDEKFDRDALDAKQKAEAEAKALVEQQKKEQDEREGQIRLKAAADARIAAEQKAESQRLALEAKAQKAIEDKLKSEQDARDAKSREALLVKQAAQRKIDQEVENKRLAGIAENNRLQAIEDARQAEIKAEQTRLQADEDTRQAAIRAENNRLQAIENERLAGIQRQNDAEAKLKREADQREANTKYKKKVNQAIIAAFVGDGLSEADSIKAMKLLVKKLVPQVTVNY